MPLDIPTDQKKLQALVDRRHPAYEARLAHWRFCRATYDGGRDWFKGNIFRYLKEGKREFEDRVVRAYRFNHTREVVHLVTKYIFKSGIIRNLEEAPEPLKAFWRSATTSGMDIDEFMGGVCNLSSIYGRVWVVVDSRVAPGTQTREDEKAAGNRIFAYTVTPEDMLDYAFDEAGRLRWAMWRIAHRDDEDPIASSGAVFTRYVLWTREEFAIFEETGTGNKRRVELVQKGRNELGEVPVFPVDDRPSDDPYDVPALIGDIAYLDRAVANYLSNLDAIIQDQTFSQLVMPIQGMHPGEDAHQKVLEMGTKRIFTYDADGNTHPPQYIAPDPKQAGVIIAVINKIIAEIYHTVGMAGERTKQDNAVGIDNSSGVAKAYDFERVNSLLTAKAAVLDRAENRLAHLVCGWAGVRLPEDREHGGAKDLVKYPESFDVRSLYDEFEVAENLALLEAPPAVRREQMRALVDKLFPRLSDRLLEEMRKDIDDWPPPQPVGVESALMISQRSKGAIGSLRRSAGKAAGGENRQGQVTSTTGGGQRKTVASAS